MNTTKFEQIKIDLIMLNEGQIEGLPANPRKMDKAKFAQLKNNITQYPEMLEARGLIVYPLEDKYVVIGGNMRLKALQELGYEEAPCVILPKERTAEQLQAYTILDNNQFGEWDWDLLSAQWDSNMLEGWGLDMNFTLNLQFDKEEDEGLEDNSSDDDGAGTTKSMDFVKVGSKYKIPCSEDEFKRLVDSIERYVETYGMTNGYFNNLLNIEEDCNG